MRETKKIYITDRFSTESKLWLEQQLQTHFSLTHSDHPQALSDQELMSAHALIIRSRTKINESLLKKARQLQLIVTCTSGFDHIDLEACEKWGITVMHTPDAQVESVAQLTWSLILACNQKINFARKMIDSSHWQRELLALSEISGRQLGIIGLGRIGRRVARIAQAFHMNVVAYDPYINDQVFQTEGVQKIDLEKLFATSDFISLHVPKTLETDYLIQRDLLHKVKPGAILVNTSRGSVIKTDDLVDSLRSNLLGSAGLDVFEVEPLPQNSELLQLENVVLTPHIGAHTEEAFAKACSLAAHKIVDFFASGQTSDTLPPRVPWYGVPAAR